MAAQRVLSRSQLASAIGDGSFYVTSALFFSYELGLSSAAIGVALTVAWSLGFVFTAPIGQLADRLGLRETAVVLALLTSFSLACFVFTATAAGSMGAFVAALIVYAIAQSGAAAVRQALLAQLTPPADRVIVRARLQSVVNAGIGVGAGLGGLALHAQATWAFVSVLVLDAIAFGVSALLLRRLPTVASPRPRGLERAAVLRDRPYVAAAGLNAVLYLYMPMLSVALPLYIAQRTGAPGWMMAVLFGANTLGVLGLQVPAARRVCDLVSAAASVRRAGLLLLAACVAFWLAALPTSALTASAVLLVGMALQVLGEVFLAAGSWEIGFGLADPDRPGQWQGVYSAGLPVARALGPVVLTAVVLDWSGPGWLVLGGVFTAASFALTPVTSWGQRRRNRTNAQPSQRLTRSHRGV